MARDGARIAPSVAEVVRQLERDREPLVMTQNGDAVIVYLIVDGRRDMQRLLERRLLGA